MSRTCWRPDVRGARWSIRAGRRVRAWLAPMGREVVGVAAEKISGGGGHIRVKGSRVELRASAGDRWAEE